ncbi:MAG: hypothetical protein QM756_09510 [Polyangiaceae bacterium]
MNYCLANAGGDCTDGSACEPGSTRWDAVKGGIADFLLASSERDMNLALGFFPAGGAADIDAISCDLLNYATPVITFTPIGGVANDIVSVLSAAAPGSPRSPVALALDGALQYAKVWAESHPQRKTAVVLITDSYDSEPSSRCNAYTQTLESVAAAGYGTAPSVRSFFIGLGTAVVSQGGAEKSYSFNLSDVSRKNVANALALFADQDPRCSVPVPRQLSFDQGIDHDRVQVLLTNPGGVHTEIPKLLGAVDCEGQANGGWYYADRLNLDRIELCPCSCSAVSGNVVSVLAGCDTLTGFP